jgi:hypothetical protein
MSHSALFPFLDFPDFVWAPGCAAFCGKVIEYGGNRGNALWDLVISVSP